jgi:hypothetical protein
MNTCACYLKKSTKTVLEGFYFEKQVSVMDALLFESLYFEKQISVLGVNST